VDGAGPANRKAGAPANLWAGRREGPPEKIDALVALGRRRFQNRWSLQNSASTIRKYVSNVPSSLFEAQLQIVESIPIARVADTGPARETPHL
jgi:hypothetical protein